MSERGAREEVGTECQEFGVVSWMNEFDCYYYIVFFMAQVKGGEQRWDHSDMSFWKIFSWCHELQ